MYKQVSFIHVRIECIQASPAAVGQPIRNEPRLPCAYYAPTMHQLKNVPKELYWCDIACID